MNATNVNSVPEISPLIRRVTPSAALFKQQKVVSIWTKECAVGTHEALDGVRMQNLHFLMQNYQNPFEAIGVTRLSTNS